MTDWRQELRTAIKHEAWLDRLVALAHDTIRATPGWDAGQFDDETLRQTVRAFVGLVSEGLDRPGEEDSGPTWQLFMGATIPAYVAAGQSADSLVRASTTFVVLVTAELVSSVPPATQRDALQWLAAFAGRYVSALNAAAAGASA